VVLATGWFLIGSKLDQNLAVLCPNTLTWTTVSQTGKIDGFNSEEGWVLMPMAAFSLSMYRMLRTQNASF
jgi:hypothetical protein